MQQLLDDRATDTDDALVRELFLPANVRLVLTSALDSTPLHELARLADRTVDAAPPLTGRQLSHFF